MLEFGETHALLRFEAVTLGKYHDDTFAIEALTSMRKGPCLSVMPALIWRRSASPRPAGPVPLPCAAPELLVCTRAAVMPPCITTKIAWHSAFLCWYKQLAIK